MSPYSPEFHLDGGVQRVFISNIYRFGKWSNLPLCIFFQVGGLNITQATHR